MTRPEKWLKWLLRIIGCSCLPAFVAVVMPQSWLIGAISYFDPDLEVGLLITYLARCLSAFYVLLGILCLLFASNVRAYKNLIKWVSIWSLTLLPLMVVMLIVSVPGVVGMKLFQYVVGDILTAVITAVGFLLMLRNVQDFS
ncbi:MAG: hypothetical protein P1V20_07455 [Verrucomicrobiales bacterium]|nr:hypothetical protein [Verrucomicrobiales bacterium]